MSAESSRDRLPFEPRTPKNKKKKTAPAPVTPVVDAAPRRSGRGEPQRIPEEVSKRMMRRMLGFSGIPTAMGVFVFFAAYWVVSHQWLELPNTAVLLVSMGCFGLGVLGLSYGILSTSWDEDQPGSFLGGEQVATNWSRITAAWRVAREENQGKSSPKPR